MSVTLEPCRWSYLDGGLVETSQAQLPADNHALNFGTAAFESLRLYDTPAGPRLVGLADHLERLRVSQLALGLAPVDAQAVTQAVSRTITQNDLKEGYLRLLVYPAGNCLLLDPSHHRSALLVLAWRLSGSRFWPALTLGLSHLRRPPAGCSLPRAKVSGFYAVDVAAHHTARLRGFDDAIILHHDGTVCEVTGANLFMVRKDALLTPTLPQSIDGITRRLIFEVADTLRFSVKEAAFPPEDLIAAEEAFLTGTFHGIRPVSEIEGHRLRGGAPGRVTSMLQERLEKIINDPNDSLAARWLAGAVIEEADVLPRKALKYIIQPAQLIDIPQVVAGVSSLLEELRGIPGSQAADGAEMTCERIINGDTPGAIFVAYLEDEDEPLLGFITLAVHEVIRVGGNQASIQELWVHPEYRSTGIGAALIKAVEDHCLKQKLSQLEVGLPSPRFPQFQRTYQFYQNCGFVDVGPRMRKEV